MNQKLKSPDDMIEDAVALIRRARHADRQEVGELNRRFDALRKQTAEAPGPDNVWDQALHNQGRAPARVLPPKLAELEAQVRASSLTVDAQGLLLAKQEKELLEARGLNKVGVDAIVARIKREWGASPDGGAPWDSDQWLALIENVLREELGA